jgi:hypothetical protein
MERLPVFVKEEGGLEYSPSGGRVYMRLTKRCIAAQTMLIDLVNKYAGAALASSTSIGERAQQTKK